MTILALNSSNHVFSAALHHNDKTHTLAEDKQPASQYALPLIAALLKQAGITLADCDAFAFGAGPGAFSALRMVCAFVQGFAYAHHKPVCAVPSLLALANANAPHKDKLSHGVLTMHCALPAHRDHLYYAACTRNESQQWQAHPPRLLDISTLDKHFLTKRSKNTFACGEGFIQQPQLVGDVVLLKTAPFPAAESVCDLAADMLARNDTMDALCVQPLYVRQKVAQTIKERKAAKQAKAS